MVVVEDADRVALPTPAFSCGKRYVIPLLMTESKNLKKPYNVVYCLLGSKDCNDFSKFQDTARLRM